MALRSRWKAGGRGKRRTAARLEHCFNDALVGCVPCGAALYYLSGLQQPWTAGRQAAVTSLPNLFQHLSVMLNECCTDTYVQSSALINSSQARLAPLIFTGIKESTVFRVLCVHKLHAAGGTSRPRRNRLPFGRCRRAPGAVLKNHFQSRTSFHRARGQEGPQGTLPSLINMNRKVHTHCLGFFFFITALRNICWLLFSSYTRENKKKGGCKC